MPSQTSFGFTPLAAIINKAPVAAAVPAAAPAAAGTQGGKDSPSGAGFTTGSGVMGGSGGVNTPMGGFMSASEFPFWPRPEEDCQPGEVPGLVPGGVVGVFVSPVEIGGRTGDGGGWVEALSLIRA